jgi:hypothetical protein
MRDEAARAAREAEAARSAALVTIDAEPPAAPTPPPAAPT